MWRVKIELLPMTRLFHYFLPYLKIHPNQTLSIFTCDLQMRVRTSVFEYPLRPTLLSFYYMGQWVHRLSGLSQTSHIARGNGNDVGGAGGGDYTHYLSKSSSNCMATVSSISFLLTSTSNIWFWSVLWFLLSTGVNVHSRKHIQAKLDIILHLHAGEEGGNHSL